MNNKYVNIYTVGIALAAVFISLLISKIFNINELTIILVSFILIMLAFKLSCSNKFEKFISNSKKYYIAFCILIPFILFFRMQLSEELPKFVDDNLIPKNYTEIKVQDFTNNPSYLKSFQSSEEKLIIKPHKNQSEIILSIFSFSEVCDNINNAFRSKVSIISWVFIIILGVVYFGLLIAIKLSSALT